MSRTCSACGARQSDDSTRCELCGLTTAEARNVELSEEAPVSEPPPATLPEDEATQLAAGHVFCTDCGAKSSVRARFCWQCGTALMAGDDPVASPDLGDESVVPVGSVPATESAAMTKGGVDPAGRHALLLVAGAAAIVILLFAITQISGRVDPLTAPPDPATGQATPAASLPDGVGERAALLEERIAASSDGEERLELRQDLVQILIEAGAFAQAGDVQEAVAREVQTVDAWAEAGSFFLAHVLRAPTGNQVGYAMRSAQAFEQALELNPGDLDIMTDLATAYRYHPENPMRAVELVREVIETDADHVRARFNYALMLAEIGRAEQAREQLELVVAVPNADEFVQERAREMLQGM